MNGRVIDMHVHMGLRGDKWPGLGHFSDDFAGSIAVSLFLFYNRLTREDLTDEKMRVATVNVLAGAREVDHIVCLALDPPFDHGGNSLAKDAPMWVSGDYVLGLREELGGKVLYGASVHPYDPTFRARVRKAVDQNAVLLKWMPSVQAINLADPRVGEALKFLATAGAGGRPLPLLLHVGHELTIPPIDARYKAYDYLSWSAADAFWNWFRGAKKWTPPQREGIHRNLRAGLDAGAVIIFAHCGTPFFAGGRLGRLFEHSDFRVVRRYLRRSAYRGRVFADVSAMVTPFRQVYFPAIRNLPPASLMLGSDFPVPIFELSADLRENLKDLKAALEGHLENIVIPDGNLIDVNCQQLRRAFGDHPMFTNFGSLM